MQPGPGLHSVGARGVEAGGFDGCGRVVARDRLRQTCRIDADQTGELGNRWRLEWRHLGPDRALIARNVEQRAVEYCESGAIRRGEMDGPRKPFPGFVHQAKTL